MNRRGIPAGRVRPRKRRWIAPVVLLSFLAGGAGASLFLAQLLVTPWRGRPPGRVLFQIPSGSSTLSILTALAEGGLLRDRRLGSIALQSHFRGKTLKAGEYRFEEPLSPVDLLRPIVAGDVVRWKVTIPEGLAADEVFSIFEARDFGKAAEFDRLFKEPSTFGSLPKEAETLEGFLYPQTYTLTRPKTSKEIVDLLIREFRQSLPPQFASEAERAGLSILQAVTLASMIEKETSLASERPLVAAVYHNRLRIGMPLQCDPTVIYALRKRGDWKGPLNHEDLGIDDPYNTYNRRGLPPGPICSPGLASLQAAVAPARSQALYFVAKGAGDGSHTFSESYEGQQHNVAQYRRTQRAARNDRALPSAR